MGRRYTKSVRIFENDFLESLTHVHPIVPLVLWVPIISYMLYYSNVTLGVNFVEMAIWLPISLFIWTLTEYVLHRYVFHFDGKDRVTKYLVYLFHGLHHDDPQDPTRLVMPPVPALLIAFLIYLFFKFPFQMMGLEKYIFVHMAFFMVGYLIYDYIHYATHHFPMKGKVGRYLRKWHLQHHFKFPDAKYGVSNPFWDYVFRTVWCEPKNIDQQHPFREDLESFK